MMREHLPRDGGYLSPLAFPNKSQIIKCSNRSNVGPLRREGIGLVKYGNQEQMILGGETRLPPLELMKYGVQALCHWV